jgi:hypothetical protein
MGVAFPIKKSMNVFRVPVAKFFSAMLFRVSQSESTAASDWPDFHQRHESVGDYEG